MLGRISSGLRSLRDTVLGGGSSSSSGIDGFRGEAQIDTGQLPGALAQQQQDFDGRVSQRDELLGAIDTGFADRERQAGLTADAYRDAGFTNLADKYRQAFRHNAFNMARRGLGGGSADIDTQVRQHEDFSNQALGVEAQANQMYGDRLMQSMQQQFGLQQSAFQNPFEANVEQQRLAGIAAHTRRLMGVHDAATDARNAQVQSQFQQAQALQQLLGGAGSAIGTGIAMRGGGI